MRKVQIVYLFTAVVALASAKSVSDYKEGRGLLGNLLGVRTPAPAPAPAATGFNSNNVVKNNKGGLLNLLQGVTSGLGQTLQNVGSAVNGLTNNLVNTVDNLATGVINTVTGSNGLGLNLGAQVQTGANLMNGVNNGMFGQYPFDLGYDLTGGFNFGGGTPVPKKRFYLLIMKMPRRF